MSTQTPQKFVWLHSVFSYCDLCMDIGLGLGLGGEDGEEQGKKIRHNQNKSYMDVCKSVSGLLTCGNCH